MEATPLAAKFLAKCLAMHNWQQSDLAKSSGIAAPTLSAQLSCTRPIRDDHLAAYCAVLDRHEQSILVAAWLRDVLSKDSQEAVLQPDGTRLKEEARAWRPGLDAEQQQMLDWWSHKLAADDELDDIFRAITKKAGKHRPSRHSSPARGADGE